MGGRRWLIFLKGDYLLSSASVSVCWRLPAAPSFWTTGRSSLMTNCSLSSLVNDHLAGLSSAEMEGSGVLTHYSENSNMLVELYLNLFSI